MIWYSTMYVNKEFVKETGIVEIKEEDGATYRIYAIVRGVTHVIGESDDAKDAQSWLDKWPIEEK